MIIVDTGSIPKTHPLRMQSKGYKSTVWVISSSIDDAFDCDFLLEFGFPVSDEGVFGQWISGWHASDDLNELVEEAKRLGLNGVRGVV